MDGNQKGDYLFIPKFFFASPLYPTMQLNYNNKGSDRNVEEHLDNGKPSTGSKGHDSVEL